MVADGTLIKSEWRINTHFNIFRGGRILYVIDNESSVPIYIQIAEQTREAILKGYLKEGDKFYSVREMAKTLLINQSTVTKAYRELEEMGLIESVVGSGTIIKIDKEKRELQRIRAIENLKSSLLEAIYYDIDIKEIEGYYKEIKGGML